MRTLKNLSAIAVVASALVATLVSWGWSDLFDYTAQAYVATAALLPVCGFALQALRGERWKPWLALSVVAYGAWVTVAFITMYDFG